MPDLMMDPVHPEVSQDWANSGVPAQRGRQTHTAELQSQAALRPNPDLHRGWWDTEQERRILSENGVGQGFLEEVTTELDLEG